MSEKTEISIYLRKQNYSSDAAAESWIHFYKLMVTHHCLLWNAKFANPQLVLFLSQIDSIHVADLLLLLKPQNKAHFLLLIPKFPSCNTV
jgi:hypothetical protein